MGGYSYSSSGVINQLITGGAILYAGDVTRPNRLDSRGLGDFKRISSPKMVVSF